MHRQHRSSGCDSQPSRVIAARPFAGSGVSVAARHGPHSRRPSEAGTGSSDPHRQQCWSSHPAVSACEITSV
jgi:hypothetical protein